MGRLPPDLICHEDTPMLLLAGLAVDDHRSAREKRDETLCSHADADGPTQLVCCREITPNARRARHPAAERGSVQQQIFAQTTISRDHLVAAPHFSALL